MTEQRQLLNINRIVVKLGSRALAEDPSTIERIAADVASLRADGRNVVLVSSGAIALGLRRLGYRCRPTETGRLQAAAAAGQSMLMRRYDECFGGHGLTTAQILLTYADLADRDRVNNARRALAALIEGGAVPVINENDTVATDELHFGDNDQLAAMVAPLVGADLLVLLTDVDGVLDEHGERIPVMTEDTQMGSFADLREGVGAGGMDSKVGAARKASVSGAAVVIAPASRPHVLAGLLRGEDIGTFFPPRGARLRARKHWIAFTLRPRGAVLLDAGAVEVILRGKSSLLAVGVLGVRGQFNPGDAIRLLDPQGREVGRGLSRLGALDLARCAGMRREELIELSGSDDVVVVHKDDLVVEP